MPPAAPQYAPSQILEAGRRAETEGRVDYAIQFYRHLTDHYANGPEAEAAHDALDRIFSHRAGELAPAPPVNGAQYFAAGPPPVPAQAWPPPQQDPSGITIAPLEGSRPLPPLVLPKLQNYYRTGRTIARLLTWAGGAFAVAGLAASALLILAPHRLAAVPIAAEWLPYPIAAPAAAIGGVLAMLLGQLARAAFEQANATRSRAAIARAQAEHRAGGGTWYPPD